MSKEKESVPQWKRELIDRRRVSGQAASVGPLQFTCPGVVSALRQPDDRDLSPGMRLPNKVSDIQQTILYQIELERKTKMGEEKAKKASAAGEGKNGDSATDEGCLSDSSEEFKYGPGIVSKLKSKYLSLTLRETHTKVRPALSNMRRATSLENILDETDKQEEEEVKQPKFIKHVNFSNGTNLQSRRGISRSKENMKRARSVEALMRYNRSPEQAEKLDQPPPPADVDKSRNRVSLEEKELPPPHLVKQTLRLFEPEGAKPPPAPLFKVPSIPKNIAQSAKPVISPKPTSQEPRSPKSKLSPQNGHASFEENKQKVREVIIAEAPRIAAKDVIKIPAKVEIIENVKSVTHEKPKDHVDACNTKETSPLKKMRILQEQPVSEVKKSVVSNGVDVPSVPSPRPRLLPKAAERRQVDTPPLTPPTPPAPAEVLRPISPVVPRTPPEILHSPSSPMKQVGVIRPMITQKYSSPVSQPPVKSPKAHNERELEKNLLNKVKSVEQPVTKVIVSLKKSPEECTVAPKVAVVEDRPNSGCTWGPKPHSMVFNFSNRKDVPDYIENDGLIMTSKKDRLKVGDSGVILLPGGTADSTSDFDTDEPIGPPSPCHLVIVGGNVLINGKSSLQKAPNAIKLRIRFNDEVTTFEYPSESSMLEDTQDSRGHHPLRGGSLASYTPSQLAQSSEFQLGITRTVAPPPVAAPKPAESSDEEEYLRPSEDPVAWSADTASDLLF